MAHAEPFTASVPQTRSFLHDFSLLAMSRAVPVISIKRCPLAALKHFAEELLGPVNPRADCPEVTRGLLGELFLARSLQEIPAQEVGLHARHFSEALVQEGQFLFPAHWTRLWFARGCLRLL